MNDMQPLINTETKLRVSSVLNRDTKSYGKQFLSDGKEETCWNSDQGDNQWIIVSFCKPIRIKKFEFKFQGGFCAAHGQLECIKSTDTEKNYTKLMDFYPQDINSEQIFEIAEQLEPSDTFKFNFVKLTDFFGRITNYLFRKMSKIVYITRIESFSSAHRLHNKSLSEEENKQIFSKCNNCHGHNYKVEITVKGTIDPRTGMVINITILKKIIQDVLDRLDHKNLDEDVPYFKNVVSTTENLCVFVWDQIESKLISQPDSDCSLFEVKLHETDKNICCYRGEEAKF
ncbi:6-pyruvoyl tetrahydrobiopterin synthase [Brachionus plicatilis]|uniref:6-pyruvoyl tetrahydrobiopterin synthase n=1 Tax=Brachionus plicatilis TaxID=10195 RepID=A0A3M7QI35_BRAPC|nr:6-pyruvoyl tetrahydrobiopterin synthase [Brachionus plicatilis]